MNSEAGVKKKEGERSTAQIRLFKPTKEKALSSGPTSSSVLLSLHVATQSLVVSDSLLGMKSLGHASLLCRNSTKAVETVLHHQPLYSSLKQAI